MRNVVSSTLALACAEPARPPDAVRDGIAGARRIHRSRRTTIKALNQSASRRMKGRRPFVPGWLNVETALGVGTRERIGAVATGWAIFRRDAAAGSGDAGRATE